MECQHVEVERFAVEHGNRAVRRFGDGHDGGLAWHDTIRQVERMLHVAFDGTVIDAKLPTAVHGAAVFRKREIIEMEGDGTIVVAFALQFLDSAAFEVYDVAFQRVEADEDFVVIHERRFAFDGDVRRCAVDLDDFYSGGSAIFADALIDGIAGGPWRGRRAWTCINSRPVAFVIDVIPTIRGAGGDALRLFRGDDLEIAVVMEQLQIHHDAADAAVIAVFEGEHVFTDAEIGGRKLQDGRYGPFGTP